MVPAARRPYIAPMHPLTGIGLFLLTVLGMEVFAYAAHRWVMHGPGWFLHKSHHEPRSGAFELNDLYAAIFAVPSFVLILGGVQLGWWPGYAWIGAGIAAYGAIYFGFHDVIVHQRLPHRYVPRGRYMKRIVQAHRLHHAVSSKHGTVSFGFLWAPRAETLKRQLRERGGALRVGRNAD
jgi:beta-carotene 3-hydroxylase